MAKAKHTTYMRHHTVSSSFQLLRSIEHTTKWYVQHNSPSVSKKVALIGEGRFN